jgi:DNA-binding CsgD family transcriptional regulator
MTVSNRTKDKVCLLWHQGHSLAEIAVIMRRSRNSICGIVRRAGLHREGRPARPKPPCRISQLVKHDALIRTLAADGHSDSQIAQRVMVSANTVCAYRAKNGIKSGRAVGGQPSSYFSPFRLIEKGPTPERADELFAEAMAKHGGQFGDALVPVEHRARMPRPDPADGMGASSAYTCAQAGAR